ncbi:MAG TPA: hypothetical protein VEI96_10275 [Thermodesulfovibrionales bacterium]|nr:hypothetical protein [Thermodesulfovibrionales bacterium]
MNPRQQYTEKMELAKKNRLAAGLISERFPGVSGIMIHLTYYQKITNPILMVRTVHLLPADCAYFNMECMIKGCDNGGFDLSSIISGLIKKRKKSGKGTLTCRGKVDTVSTDHASVSYEISIQYHRITKKTVL